MFSGKKTLVQRKSVEEIATVEAESSDGNGPEVEQMLVLILMLLFLLIIVAAVMQNQDSCLGDKEAKRALPYRGWGGTSSPHNGSAYGDRHAAGSGSALRDHLPYNAWMQGSRDLAPATAGSLPETEGGRLSIGAFGEHLCPELVVPKGSECILAVRRT